MFRLAKKIIYPHYERKSLMLNHKVLIYYFSNAIIEAITKIYNLFDFRIGQLVLLQVLSAFI